MGAAGVLSDTIGRRPIIITSTTTLLLSGVLLLCTAFFELHLNWVLAANAVSGLTGNFVTMLMAIFAGVTDISTAAQRTVLVAKAEGSIFLGAG